MITERQEKILNILTQEYIKTAKPVSSKFLEKKCKLGICPATIRIELQRLTDLGLIGQPHTSAGRVPTNKGYRFFIDKFFSAPRFDKTSEYRGEDAFSAFIFKEIEGVKKQIEDELKLAEELRKSLEEISSALSLTYLPEKDVLFEILTKLAPSRTTYDKNISLMNSLIKELERLEG